MNIDKQLPQLEKILAYTFSDKALLKLALSHRSVGAKNNERLEFLGDSILNFVVSGYIFNKFTVLTEGELTRMRASLVQGKTISQIARRLQLDDYILLGPGEKKTGGHQRSSVLADAFEAIIGAIYLDAGIEQVRSFIYQCYTEEFSSLSDSLFGKDPKTMLQEYLQAHQMALPEYEVTHIDGPPHQQHFSVCCVIDSIDKKTDGEGTSRREAEQIAASKMLSLIKAEKQKKSGDKS